MFELLPLPLLELLAVLGESIKQMVDDVGSEYLHAELIGHLLRVTLDLTRKKYYLLPNFLGRLDGKHVDGEVFTRPVHNGP